MPRHRFSCLATLPYLVIAKIGQRGLYLARSFADVPEVVTTMIAAPWHFIAAITAAMQMAWEGSNGGQDCNYYNNFYNIMCFWSSIKGRAINKIENYVSKGSIWFWKLE